VRNNAYVHELSLENLAVILDPRGPATIAIVNYAPLQLLVHALAWRAFGPDTLGHHLVNVVLHAAASVLLVALLAGSGLPRTAALLGGAFFLLHPANVEAVAWISQLKSALALPLSLGALLVHPRRPWLSAALFGLALLAKPTAAFVLPVAALLDWTQRGRVRWTWVLLCSALLAAFALAEFATHQRSGAAETGLYHTPLVLLRTMGAIAMRYLVMAATSWGVSAFHEPPPALSWLDPWWLASLPVLLALGLRVRVLLRRRDPELAWWAWAAVSYAPVSQLFPFLYPMADRYLYFILPGWIGAVLLAGREAFAHLPPRVAARRAAAPVALVLAGAVLLACAARARERAAIWRSDAVLAQDAARHYPDGKVANVLRAKRAALAGDAQATVSALRRAAELGYNRYDQLEIDPAYDGVRQAPAFRALVRELAAGWIERGREKPNPTQAELRSIAQAHIARGEVREALAALEQAQARGGPATEAIGAEIEAVRMALERGAPEGLRLGVTDDVP
jgi:hypothetical protein